MAVDLEAIRRRVQELSGNKKFSDIQQWKPGVGEHRIRGLPSDCAKEGMPITERWFYYLGDNFGFLTPKQFNKPDPINDLITKLYSTKKPEDREIAKSLLPKMRAFLPIIVRGEEDKGVMIWAFGKPIYNRLLSFYTEDDVGDILDVDTGFDLKVTVTHTAGKMFKGKPSLDYQVDAARKPTKLSEDPAKVKKILESIPNIDDMNKQKSTQEIETLLNNWLSGGADEGSAKGGDSSKSSGDDLDQLVKDVKSSKDEKSSSKEESKKEDKEAKKPAKKSEKEKSESDSVAKSTADLDDAFAEIMDSDDLLTIF